MEEYLFVRVPNKIQLRILSTEAEYIAASERKWFGSRSSLDELGVVPSIVNQIPLYCDNNRAIAQAKEPRSHQRDPNMFSGSTI